MPLTRIRKLVSSLGYRESAVYLLAKLLGRLSHGYARIVRYHLVAQPVATPPHSAATASNKTTVRIIEGGDPVIAHFPRPLDVVTARFKSGAVCLVAEVGDRFAGFIWLKRDGYDEDEVRCRFELAAPKTCAWDFDVYVEPDFRIGRTFSRLWAAANDHLGASGVEWTLSRIATSNPGSLASHQRMGLQQLGRATFICVGTTQLALLPAPPYLHLSRPPNRPTIRLAPLPPQDT